MKKKLLTLILPLMAFACLFTACSDDEGLVTPGHVDNPAAIRYDLPKSFCLSSVEDHKAIIVRTSEEFNELFAEENFVSPYEKVTLPPIDFNKYDLFYAQGNTTTEIYDFHADMNTNCYPYRLWVYVQTSMLASLDSWSVGYLVQKDDWNDQVKLDLVIID